MQDVNIYIETSIKGVQSQKAAGIYVMECIKYDGDDSKVVGTKDGLVCMENATEKELVLELLKDAFSRFTKSCSVQVITKCGYISGAINKHWFLDWKKNGWISKKGAPVAYKEIWEPLSEFLERHLVSVNWWNHSYSDIMQYEINKELQARQVAAMAVRRDVLAEKL